MTATIERIEGFVYRAPIATPVANAFGAMSNRPALFVRVRASDGAYGWGEAFCNFPQVGAEHRARLLDSIFAPLLAGTDATDPPATFAMLSRSTRQMAIQSGEPGPFAAVTGAIDQALWDMSARRAGEPLWRHLGGTSPRVNVYASGIGPDDVVPTALRKRDEGYRAFKLKVGFDASRDPANLAALREALGDEATIMTDANQGWSAEEASSRIAALAPFRPHWIEEPILADQSAFVWKRIAKDSAVPIAAGENIRGTDDFDVAFDYLAFVQPDVGKWGGITACREVALRARDRGVTFCPHWLGGGVGLAASLHLLAAAGGEASYAETDANPNPLREEVFATRLVDGAVTLDDAPGLGVEPDLERLASLRSA
ncbi:MAG TPA: mandelate racemase/muconate lactonizing enzyme family protein [Casimicrobiaceae bacterium]|nr:mandelate racemase/muconate lactonizing enzyme family protein [Casimicrobiaceae bacterium]